MEAYVRRSQKIHSLINAVTDERYAEALEDAAGVDEFLASSEKLEEQIATDTPLLGVPFTCKEALGVKGMTQNSGWVRAKERRAKEDCAAAAMYRKAGAIPFAVTNVSLLCTWWEAANHLYGRTKNPYDNIRTPGGSSGGEAAIITSAGSLIGIGRDGGGSIRTPAAFCGIYGHKSTGGIVSNRGAYPPPELTESRERGQPPTENEEEYIHYHINTGPMCRYAKDLPLLLKVMSNYDARLRMDEKVDFRKVKMYYMTDVSGIGSRSTPRVDIKRAILKAVEYFEAKYEIQPIQLQLEEMKNAFGIMVAKKTIPKSSPIMTTLYFWLELLKSLFGKSMWTLPIIYQKIGLNNVKDKFYHTCLDEFNELESKFNQIFQEDAVFFYPTHPEPAPHYLMSIVKSRNCGYSGFFNLIQCCSTTIPAGLSDGLPIGIQAISGPFNDHLTMAVAIELEQIFHGWTSPCAINV